MKENAHQKKNNTLNLKIKNFYSDNPFPNFNISTEDKFREYCKKFAWYYKTFPQEIIANASSLSLLDCGCGTGENSCMFARRGFCVTGIDISPSSIKKAKENANNLDIKVNFMRKDVQTFNLEEKYDIVFCMGVLMCLDNPQEAFKNIASHVKKGGTLVVGVYNTHGSLFKRIHTRKKLQRIYGDDDEMKIQYLLSKNPSLKNLPNYRELILDGISVPVEKFFSINTLVSWFKENEFMLELASPPIDFKSYLFLKRVSEARYSKIDSFFSQLIWKFLKKDFFVISGKKH